MIISRHIPIICLVLSLWCSSTSASSHMKFKQWFHAWHHDLLPSNWSTGQCKAVLDAYWTSNTSSFTWPCQGSLDCILGETSQSALQELSGSLVVLGLTPTLLSTLGPSLGESAMLSFQRPGLSLLLSLGAPAIWPPRILAYEDPLLVLEKSPLTSRFLGNLWPRGQRQHQRLISVLEYILALAAIGNVIYVSLELGWKSVLSWKCEWSFFPVAWTLVPAGIHILNALAFWLTPKCVMVVSNESSSRSPEGESSIALVGGGVEP
ncbi:hypothetical protein BP6252_13222 [Coleophoma cylindrospora]|uniref:Uncharacterized protein n=1 Tax=Coleophoma cylindrospora TaxID=1849047 RepID=A0A3D8QA95_9HELO|nr:hypothetical protein BP6252_13222 [Coleophoma cylindrospora]